MKLKEFRLKNHYTQSETAYLLGIDRILFNKIERGVCMPSPQILLKLTEIFKCDVCELFTTEELNILRCATSKKGMCTPRKLKSRVNTYNYCVRVKIGDFPLLNKTDLKNLGFLTNCDFLKWAYEKLEQHLENKKEE